MFGILIFLSLKRSLKRNLVNLIFPRGRVIIIIIIIIIM